MKIKPGDIIGFTGGGPVSAGINLATYGSPWSGLSHVGIVASLHDEPIIYESTSFERPPCIRMGKPVKGVQAHRLHDVIKWEYAKVWHIPLRRKLYYHEEDRLFHWLDEVLGVQYDTIGAGRSGGIVFRTLQAMIRPEDLASLFCSELAAAALANIGVFPTRSASKWSPNGLYRTLRRRGIVNEKRRLK